MRRAYLDQLPCMHHGDLIGDSKRFALIVGNINSRDIDPPLEILDLSTHLLPQLGIQVAQRLVQEHHLGLVHESPSKGDSLLLPSREFRRRAIFQPMQTDNF